MYGGTSYFDTIGVPLMANDCYSQAVYINNGTEEEDDDTMRFTSTFSIDELSNPINISAGASSDDAAAAATAAAMQLDDHLVHNHLSFDLDPPPSELHAATWDNMQQEYPMHCYDADPTMYAAGSTVAEAAPDLLNLLHHPQYAMAPAFPPASDAVYGDGRGLYDLSALHSDYTPLQPQAQMLRDLFQSLPQSYGLFCGGEEREAAAAAVGGGGEGVMLQEMGGISMRDGGDLSREIRGEINGGRCFPTERQRRMQFNEKYRALRSLVPNPTKSDRASIVGDAIEYIKELHRTVMELKILVENKRHARNTRRRSPPISEEAEAAGDVENSTMRLHKVDSDHGGVGGGAMRSSWLQRRSKQSFVDVRVIEEEVNIKLTQKRNVSCLLTVAKALDEINVDLRHVAGGFIANHYVFMLNAKVNEGSSVHAGVIAKKIIQVMDTPNNSSYVEA